MGWWHEGIGEMNPGPKDVHPHQFDGTKTSGVNVDGICVGRIVVCAACFAGLFARMGLSLRCFEGQLLCESDEFLRFGV